MRALFLLLNDTFLKLNLLEPYAKLIAVLLTFSAIIVLAGLVNWITKKVVVKVVHRLVKNTKTEWDNYLMNRKVFHSLSHLTSALVIYYTGNFSHNPDITSFLSMVTNIYFVIIFVKVFSGVLNATNDFYLTTPHSAIRSIKGYIQLVLILIYFVAAIFIIAFVFNKSPLVLITGLGAIAAVLLIVFKDTILGLVAGIQLSGNKMLKPGDWIEMPKHGANGTVIDISLNTVKVQNFDNTITTVPTYSLVAESFVNWSGMEESEGRRLKRSINLDMKSIRFCDEKMLNHFMQFKLIRKYLIEKQDEISEYNKNLGPDMESGINGRRQTNLGVFRKYLEKYLENNPNINNEMTFMVRQLQPSETGLPIEIYAFSKVKQWVEYESIQSDIFDHILAVIPEFELSVFQSPSGNDIKNISEKLTNSLNNVQVK